MKKSRRDILKIGAMAGAGMLIPPLSQRQRPTPSELAQDSGAAFFALAHLQVTEIPKKDRIRVQQRTRHDRPLVQYRNELQQVLPGNCRKGPRLAGPAVR